MLAPLDPALRARLRAAEATLDSGEQLSEEETAYLVQRTAVRLLGSRRPSIARAAFDALRALLERMERDRKRLAADDAEGAAKVVPVDTSDDPF